MDFLWAAAFMLVGLCIGFASLPWSPRRESEWLWVLAWACFWPGLLVHLCWHGILIYRQAWWRYLGTRQVRKLNAKEEGVTDDDRFRRDSKDETPN